jgi:hypothetical protein
MTRLALLAVGLALAAVPARGDEADARKLIEKAVEAHGGQEALDKFPATATTFKGTFHGQGEGIPITGVVSVQGADKQKIEMEVEAGGMKIPIVIVLAGDKGWNKFGKDVTEMDKDQVAEAKEQAYTGWIATLAPLKGKGFTFSTIGEAKVGDKVAVGVKVSQKGRRDVDLYFDKASGLLVRTEAQVKDDMTGQEVTEETVLSDYKAVKGVRHAMKFTVKRNGKLFLEGEVSEVVLSDKFDAGTFDKP